MSLPRNPAQKLVSIISASNRPHNMRGFLENLNDTLDNPDSIELLVKIDEGDAAMQTLLDTAIKTYPFKIIYIQTPRLDGYYTLHYGYQELLEISNKETYFIFPVNEEVRFKTKGWDTALKKYIHFFKDDLFRLKISRLKYRNYYSVQECGPCPENYPFMTRKWIELSGGIGDCWGPDGWHQYIDYHLGQVEGINDIPGIFRSVPIHDILIGGEEAGKELTDQQIKMRSRRIYQEWWRMFSPPKQQEFRRLASKMFAYIWAKNAGWDEFEIVENQRVRKFSVRNFHQPKETKEIYYHLPSSYIKFDNLRFLIKLVRRNSIGFVLSFIFSTYGTRSGLRKWIDQMSKFLLVCLVFPISLVTYGNESVPKPIYLRLYLRLMKVGKILGLFLFKRSKRLMLASISLVKK